MYFLWDIMKLYQREFFNLNRLDNIIFPSLIFKAECGLDIEVQQKMLNQSCESWHTIKYPNIMNRSTRGVLESFSTLGWANFKTLNKNLKKMCSNISRTFEMY